MKLFEKQRKNEKQGNTHKKKKVSDKSHKEMSVPHGLLVSYFSPTLVQLSNDIFLWNRVLAVLGIGKTSKRG